MRAVGIICEYNPFHSGHEFHIRRARECSGLPVVCVMSGHFVQRGEAAVMNKFARAEAAVSCGADLVLELPLPWACAGAQRFAEGGVGLLAATGIVSHLAFGSESADLKAITAAAQLTDDQTVNARIRAFLASGMGYAAARERAVREADPTAGAMLASPNDILGVEYVRAILRHGYPLTPLPILRHGASHDGSPAGRFASASHLRGLLRAGRGDEAFMFLPGASIRIFNRERDAGRAPVDPGALDTAILSVLRRMTAADFAALPDISEGLEFRLAKAAKEALDPADFCARAKTRRYSHARLRRICMAAFLGLTRDMTDIAVPYARVLALNDTGRALLREIRTIPVVTKAADGRASGGTVARYLSLEAQADDLFSLAYPARTARYGGQGWTQSPVYVQSTELENPPKGDFLCT